MGRRFLPSRKAEHFRSHHSFTYFRHRPGHEDGKVVRDRDGQFAAGHVNRDGRIHQAQPPRHGHGGATAAAARQRVARAALPDFDLDISPVEDFKELDVGPFREIGVGFELRPVLSWRARIVQVKRVPKGSFVGYGGTFRTTRAARLAVIPVGYYDGYGRSLSNASHVLIKGSRAAVVGRVAMNFLTADITDVPGVGLEDEVVLIGKSGREQITAAVLAALAGTISYEIVSRINPLIPRIVV